MAKKEAKRRKDGNFEYKCTIGEDVNGEKIRKSFYSSKSLKEAKAKAEKYKIDFHTRIAAGDILPLGRISFERQALHVLEIKKRKIKINTWQLNWNNVINNHLIPYFKDTEIGRIRKADIDQYFISKEDMARETLKKHLSCLQEIFKDAVDNDYLNKSPVARYSLDFGKSSQKKSVYSKEQAETVLAYATTHRFGLGVILLLEYGMSVSELLGLMYDDVDFEKKTIHIQRGVTLAENKVVIGETKNEFRNRIIAVSDTCLDMIRSKERTCDFIISNKNGTVCRPDNYRRRHFNVFMLEMTQKYPEIPALNPHELRHTRASIWVNEGRNLFAIAHEMGWSDLEMLRKRYAHPDINELRKELDL